MTSAPAWRAMPIVSAASRSRSGTSNSRQAIPRRRPIAGEQDYTHHKHAFMKIFLEDAAGHQTLINIPSRVGVVFFHKLSGCRVDWELDARSWCLEYP